MTAIELWRAMTSAHPGITVLGDVEREVFSTVPIDMPAWIGADPARLLASVKNRAISNGIGAGRGGGPRMEQLTDACHALLETGMAMMGSGIEGRIAEARRSLHTLRVASDSRARS